MQQRVVVELIYQHASSRVGATVARVPVWTAIASQQSQGAVAALVNDK
jgi:hypothetical protein